MKSFLFVALLCFLGVARRMAEKSYADYDDYDWEKFRSCHDEVSSCHPGDFPFLSKVQEIRGPQDFENFLEETNPKDICDGVLPVPQCQLTALENLSEDCKPIIFGRYSPVTYDQAVSMYSEVLSKAENVCTYKIDLLERNWQCIKNVALNHHMDLAMCTMSHPCYETETIIDCIRGVIVEESTCNEDFADFVGDNLREVREIFEPACSNLPMAGPPNKWMEFFLRR